MWTTPQAHDATGGTPERVRRHGTKHGGANLADDVTLWATPTSRDWRSDSSQKSDAEIYGTKGRPLGRQALRSGISGPPSSLAGPTSPRQQWQTPSVEDAARVGSAEGWRQYREENRTTQARLRNQVHWPTPRANDAEKRGEIANDQRSGLPAAAMWQTSRTGTHGAPGADATHGGQPKWMRLNPKFVEWLQNFPIGFTGAIPVERESDQPNRIIVSMRLQPLEILASPPASPTPS